MKNKNLSQKNVEIKVDENILLKTLILEDVLEPYVIWLNDYEVTKFTEQKYFKHKLESTKDFVIQKYNSENDLLFGIFAEGLHIGNIKLGPIKFEHMSAEVSYFIGEKKFWDKGIASKCVKAIVEFAVADLGLKKINACYYENNIGAAKVLQKCGFIVEGIQRSELIFEGQRSDHIWVGYIPN
jgi:[ribosomal protein S5]-alanine N-acetyltransferase